MAVNQEKVQNQFLCYGGTIALIFLGLLPWFVVQIDMRVPADAAWLSHAASLFLNGEHMSDAYFDNNPPMSYMIFTPVVWLAKTGLPVWHAITWYGFILAAVSFGFVVAMLKTFPISLVSKAAILASYAGSITLFAHYEFSQKDHLIAIILFPFLLAQFVLMSNVKCSKWITGGTFILGAPFILLKPHYGLLPVVMIAHRWFKNKNLAALFKADVIALIVGVFLYAFAIFLWFPDYIREALPYSVTLYVSKTNDIVFPASAGLALMALCSVIAVYALCREMNEKRIGYFLSVMALVAVVPFFTQMKGYSLHMLPALSLLFIAGFFLSAVLFEQKIKNAKRWSPFLVVVFVLGTAYMVVMPNPKYATHDSFMNHSLVQYLKEKNPANGFFMQSDKTNVIAPASLYSGYRQASRFPSLWFLPFPEGAENAEKLTNVFGRYLAEDLSHFQPDFVALYAESSEGQSVLDIFLASPDFAAEWAHYHFQGRFTLDYGESFGMTSFDNRNKKTVLYNIYVRNDD